MQIKEGVKLLGIQPQTLLGAIVADSILPQYGQEAIITSAVDGKHKRSSAHYTGRAVDLRIWDLDDAEFAVLALQKALGSEYDVILESNHIHLEFDPK